MPFIDNLASGDKILSSQLGPEYAGPIQKQDTECEVRLCVCKLNQIF
jgi:hypothetical protein